VIAPKPLVFDGHNDLLSKIFNEGGTTRVATFFEGREGAIDLKKAEVGGFGGGFFAVYVPSKFDLEFSYKEMEKASYSLPLPEPIEWSEAVAAVASQVTILCELERLGGLTICHSVSDIRSAFEKGKIAAIFHIEGAEAIDPDLHMLEVLHSAGLRSIGPVWSRPTIFGEGVPFSFPSTPDIGSGLTELGIALVKRCNELNIMIDLSHLNEAGFWDVARHSNAPLVATHSNVHSITQHSRNLTDKQLRAIADSDGMVGLNFAAAFLREDGKMLADVPLSQVLKHLDYLLEILGEDRVGLGSDYDGAIMPEELNDLSNLPNLILAMESHGYDEILIKKLCRENWLRVLQKTWGC
jgi:membrane dipeptidase